MVGCIVERAQAFVPKHTFPLVGIGSVAAHHEFEIVIMRLIAREIIQLVIEPHIVTTDECRCAHIGAVEDVNAWRKRHFC